MSRVLVAATGNRGKLGEIERLLDGFGWEIVAQSAFGVEPPPEDGLTFIENAIIKARHASRCTGRPALADDSGLVVDALGGAPGVHSARYAGPGGGDAANNEKLLRALAEVPEGERSARFECAVVWMQDPHDPAPFIARGTWTGRVLEAPQAPTVSGMTRSSSIRPRGVPRPSSLPSARMRSAIAAGLSERCGRCWPREARRFSRGVVPLRAALERRSGLSYSRGSAARARSRGRRGRGRPSPRRRGRRGGSPGRRPRAECPAAPPPPRSS